MVTLLRRVFWLAVLGGAGFAGWSAWSRRNASSKAGPPEWPPIEPPAHAVVAAASPDADAPSTDLGTSQTDAPFTAPSTSQPLQSAPSGGLTWVAPDGGACPISHPIKANSNSGIFHVPGGRFYNQTRAERCYALAEDAEVDGYRRAKS